MTQQEIEEISRRWADGILTAEEMAEMIKGKSPAVLKSCSTFDHERYEGAGYTFCPECNRQF